MYFAGLVLIEWDAAPSSFLPYWLLVLVRAWSVVYFSARMSSGFWPGRPMLRAFRHLAGVEEQVKRAQGWLEGCRTMIAKGARAPLSDAQAEVDRWTRERDEVLETLRGLGYRARFRASFIHHESHEG